MDELADFATFEFEHAAKRRAVFKLGSGPAVILMHEIPGITPEAARLARYIADAGMTVYVPHLFGTPGRCAKRAYAAWEILKICMRREFNLLAGNRSSPVVDWLRALARYCFLESGGRGVGALGMCITGNFGLTMLLDPWVVAPVLSQPSLPLPLTRASAAALHATPAAIANAKKRIEGENLSVLGLRFVGDPICSRARFDALSAALGSGFEQLELPDWAADPNRSWPPHCVLSLHLVDEEGQLTKQALNRVLGFLQRHLL